jgi:1-hydroxycarotenoid 3,4-desaturase
MSADRVVVIGAGMGGLAAAIDLARAGRAVTVLERATAPGGKMRQVPVGEARLDAGPTVFTMRWVFDALFEEAGSSFDSAVTVHKAEMLARHAWTSGGMLDLFADIDRSVQAIAAFAGTREADGYRAFCARTQEVYETLRPTFIDAQKPSPLDLVARVGAHRLGALWRTAPQRTMARALGDYFRDPRLRQLFGRYATYCGSSPYAAPATLTLIAHVERDGVFLVEGGMARVAHAMAELAQRLGAQFRYDTHVEEVSVAGGRVVGVRLADGETVAADAVVFNGDVSALGRGLLGTAASRAARSVSARQRSLSAIVWCARARTAGFPLAHHTVFFADAYQREFAAVFGKREVPLTPTVYVCAQDRGEGGGSTAGPERLLILVNAPPDGDRRKFDAAEIDTYRERALATVQACGLTVDGDLSDAVATEPDGFNALFPGSGGALYGRANHGMFASFARPGAASRVPGLYLAGGSVHPGPGVPMATLSGRLAAARLLLDNPAKPSPHPRPARSTDR